MKETFYSNGKLLITGEYLVLDGAKAFAMPTKMGQYLTIQEGKENSIYWKSYDSDQSIWFEDTITFKEIIENYKSETVKATLINILHEAYLLNPAFLSNVKGYTIETTLTFPRKWGLGTSSTLLNNIAQWLKIDAYTLLKNSFGGSGYDIACAQYDTPITYQLVNGVPKVEQVIFKPDFAHQIYFVYLNQKQSSKAAINAYYKNNNNHVKQSIQTIELLTQNAIETTSFIDFSKTIEKHEVIMSSILECPTVKEKFFSNFKGAIKSLGAWGGDFVMVLSDENPKSYFKKLGYTTILTFEEMIL